MSRYKYFGPATSVTLRINEAETVDVQLNPSAEFIECPDHPHVARLVRKGFLVPVETPAAPISATLVTSKKRATNQPPSSGE